MMKAGKALVEGADTDDGWGIYEQGNALGLGIPQFDIDAAVALAV